MRKEKYYGVFDYEDNLKPGTTLRIEHSVVQDFAEAQIDLSPFIALGAEQLAKNRAISIEAEQEIFNKIRNSVKEWERQAAVTKTYSRALEYLNTPKVSHTSNQWVHDDYNNHETISNMVYEMSFSVWEETKYDKQKGESVPVAWYVTWEIDMRSPRHGYCVEIAGQRRKRYVDKGEAEKYIAGRKKAYEKYFKEISPPIPQEYGHYFKVNDVLLPGYTIQGQKPELSTSSVAEIINEITGGASSNKEHKPSVLEKLSENKTNKSAPSKGAKRKEENSL